MRFDNVHRTNIQKYVTGNTVLDYQFILLVVINLLDIVSYECSDLHIYTCSIMKYYGCLLLINRRSHNIFSLLYIMSLLVCPRNVRSCIVMVNRVLKTTTYFYSPPKINKLTYLLTKNCYWRDT